jgi:membrane dipeptidase
VADAGGVMGVWHIFPTMKDYVTGIRQMVDVVGADHVGIGTDTSVAPTPRPPAPVNTTATNTPGAPPAGTNNSWPDEKNGFLYSVTQEMLAQGFTPAEISKVAGGNYVRLFGTVTRSTT